MLSVPQYAGVAGHLILKPQRYAAVLHSLLICVPVKECDDVLS